MAEKNTFKDPVIGIDLGTTYSCVCVWNNGKPEVVSNEQGNRTTPSFVAYTKNERLIGEPAKNQMELNPKNTVYDIKRLMGRRYNDPTIQQDLELFPFSVLNVKNKPVIEVESYGKAETYLPEEISAIILSKMKAITEKHVGSSVTKAVITVPENFNNAQREATKAAAKIAGLDVLGIMNEPTAAALAYGFKEDTTSYKNVMVFDLGGGTFDVTILSIGDNVLKVSKTNGDTHLGGEDFDGELFRFCFEDIKKTAECKDVLEEDKRSIQRLRNECEKAKRALSTASEYTIILPALFEKKDFCKKITRFKFNSLNKDHFQKTIDAVKKVLEDAGMEPNHMNEIILVGGSTRIPKIQELLKEFFKVEKLNETVHPDEAVAIGAAIRAAIINSDPSEKLSDWQFIDVNPRGLGVGLRDGTTKNLIAKNTPLPCDRSLDKFTTHKDDQESVKIKLFEGESTLSRNNHYLGEFRLSNILPAPSHTPKIKIVFELDEDGILQVSASDVASEAHNSLTIQLTDRFKEEELQEMIHRMTRNNLLDSERDEAIRSKQELENLFDSVSDEQHEKIETIKQLLADNILHKKTEYDNEINNLKRHLSTDNETLAKKSCYN